MKRIFFLLGTIFSVVTSGPANAVSVDIFGTDSVSFNITNAGLGPAGTVSVTGVGGTQNLTPGVSTTSTAYLISAVNLPDPLVLPSIGTTHQKETVTETLSFSVGGVTHSVTFNFTADYALTCFVSGTLICSPVP